MQKTLQNNGSPLRVLIVGCGPVGSAFAWHLQQQGAHIVTVYDTNIHNARCLKKLLGDTPDVAHAESSFAAHFDSIIIAVPDDALEGVVSHLETRTCISSGVSIFHTSGALPAAMLEPFKKHGAVIAALHPIQAFSTRAQAIKSLPGSTFDVQGDAAAIEVARMLIDAWGGEIVCIDVNTKVLLHIAAVFSSNFVNVVLSSAEDILKKSDREKPLELAVLQNLTQTAVANSFAEGKGALTGPVARGDMVTIKKHLAVLEEVAPQHVALYRTISSAAAKITQERGQSSRTYKELMMLLKE